jgi:hypothetical protein
MLVRPDSRLGEFRIKLTMPNLQSPQAVQHHWVYSMIWARLLSNELATRTNGICNAVITPTLFPDLRVYFIKNNLDGKSETDEDRCQRTLQQLVQTKLESEAVREAASQEKQRFLAGVNKPGGYMSAAYNILVAALTKIYRTGTLMHSLVSIDAIMFQPPETTAFFGWLESQTSVNIARIAICPPDTDLNSPQVDKPAERLPSSDTIAAPGVISLTERDVSAASRSFLRHAVIVGDQHAIVNARRSPSAVSRYCNQEQAFSINGLISPPVRVRCLQAAVYSIDGWTMLFCDAGECRSDELSEMLAKMIYDDLDLVGISRTDTNMNRNRHYLVNFESTKK